MDWVVSLLLAAIAGLVWLVRLEGKIKVQAAQALDIVARLTRIENLLDKLVRFNGH